MLRIIMIGTVEWWSGAVCASPLFVVGFVACAYARVCGMGWFFVLSVGWMVEAVYRSGIRTGSAGVE
jgi:hypothetical protein